MRWLHFILSHSVFIALCATALCYQSYAVLHIKPENAVYIFVFFATLCSYNFYWLAGKFAYRKEKSLIRFIKINFSYFIVFLFSAAVTLIAGSQLIFSLPLIILTASLTFLYSTPLWNKTASALAAKTGFLKTIILALTWGIVTVMFPAHNAIEASVLPVFLLLAARFFLMLMLCLIFDMRDIDVDKINAFHSLATDVSRKALMFIMATSFCLYVIAGLLVRMYMNDNKLLIAHLFTGMVVWIVYRLSIKKQGYLFYYFLVDGLMMVAAIATYAAGWF